MVYEKGFEKNPSAFLIYNADECKEIVDSITDMFHPGDIIVAYKYDDSVILMHPGRYYGRKGACSAIKQLLKEIESDHIHTNDEALREQTGDPNFSTQAILSKFLREELKSIQ